jgi:S1-C subfamily serine protease
MNTLDVFILFALVLAAMGGYRMGFLARVTSWVGMLIGAVLGARALPRIVDAFSSGTATERLIIVFGILLAAAFIGQALGLLVGRRLHVALPFGPARQADRVAGGVAGVAGVVFAVWLVVPIMGDVPGWFAIQSRTSAITGWVSDALPEPPDTMTTLRRLVGDSDFPRVFNALQPAPNIGPPPAASGLTQAVVDAVVPSTVKVEGVTCRRIQDGTGFVIGDGLVATNAHVVAGEDSTDLQRSDGSKVKATVVAFDPNRDIAILRAPNLNRRALPRATARVGDNGAVFGHPGGGPLRAAPFQVGRVVQAVGTDIYDQAHTERSVLILASELHPGDSGAALIDPQGRAVGIAFAIAPDKPGVAYALSMSELDAVLQADLTHEVDTGPCLR